MSLGQRLTILLKVLGVFLLIGPPIGALTLFVGIGIYGVSQTGDVATLLWVVLFGLIYAVPLSYPIGAIPAASAGLILGASAILYHKSGILFSIVIGITIGIVIVSLGGRSVTLQSGGNPSDTVSAVLLITTCLVATVLSWAVARLSIERASAS